MLWFQTEDETGREVWVNLEEANQIVERTIEGEKPALEIFFGFNSVCVSISSPDEIKRLRAALNRIAGCPAGSVPRWEALRAEARTEDEPSANPGYCQYCGLSVNADHTPYCPLETGRELRPAYCGLCGCREGNHSRNCPTRKYREGA